MPSPSEQQINDAAHTSGIDDHEVGVEYSQEFGSKDPRQVPSVDIFGLLARAVIDLGSTGRVPLAAGVGAKMRLLDPQFSQQTSGYKTFRRLLDDAALQGVISLVEIPGAQDIGVAYRQPAGPKALRSEPLEATHIQDDVWKAILDWNADVRYAYDRDLRRVQRIDTDSVGVGEVAIPSVSQELHLEWMREFAAAEADKDVREALQKGLAQTEPIRGFAGATRRFEASGRRWKKFLKKRVLDRATTWAHDNGIALADIERVSLGAVSVQAVHTDTDTGTVSGDSETRRRILAILALLPMSDLLRLPIPVEYALKR